MLSFVGWRRGRDRHLASRLSTPRRRAAAGEQDLVRAPNGVGVRIVDVRGDQVRRHVRRASAARQASPSTKTTRDTAPANGHAVSSLETLRAVWGGAARCGHGRPVAESIRGRGYGSVTAGYRVLT